jgi:hypothetical protein
MLLQIYKWVCLFALELIKEHRMLSKHIKLEAHFQIFMILSAQYSI